MLSFKDSVRVINENNLPGPCKAVVARRQIRRQGPVIGAGAAAVLAGTARLDAQKDSPGGVRRWLHVRSEGQLTRTSSMDGRTLVSS